MVPGVGLTELLVLAVVMLLVLGPRELPLMMRRLGQVYRKVRQMGREFQRGFDELGRELEMDELRKEVQRLKTGDFEETRSIARDLDAVSDDMRSVERDTPPAALGAVGSRADLRPSGADASGAGKPALSPSEPHDDEDAATQPLDAKVPGR